MALLIRALLVLAGLGGAAALILRRHLIAQILEIDPPQNEVHVKHDIAIAMPDGITLMADHYAPLDIANAPTVLIRTPYGRNASLGFFGLMSEFFAHRFAERGYHVVVQDVRGRFESEGEFAPFYNETDDGLATIQWVKAQPWYNGKLAMWGPSYLGMSQWAIADKTDELDVIVPIISTARPADVLFPDGALDLTLALRWMTALNMQYDFLAMPPLASVPFLNQAIEDAVKQANHLPLVDIDHMLTGEPIAFYQDWMANAAPDSPLYTQFNQRDYARIEEKVHIIGGWHDFFLRGTLGDYEAMREAGHQPTMTIGRLHHFEEANGMLLGLRESLQVFDAYLKHPANGEQPQLWREKPVRLFVMGREEWQDFDAWPPPSEETDWYLHGDGNLSQNPPPDLPPSGYIYDPASPTPSEGGAQFGIRAGSLDQRRIEARPDVVLYTSEPMAQDTDIIGYVQLDLYVSTSLETTDFVGRLCDVDVNGRSMNVCEGLYRIVPDDGTRLSDGTHRITIDMWATAHCFKAGHRIRLQVCSGAHPRWARNLGFVGDQLTMTDMQAAEQRIFHAPTTPSSLRLPVVTERVRRSEQAVERLAKI